MADGMPTFLPTGGQLPGIQIMNHKDLSACSTHIGISSASGAESTAKNPMVCDRLRRTATAPSASKQNTLPPSRSNRSASFKARSVRAPRRPLLMRSLPGALAPRRKRRIGTGSRRRSRRTGRRTVSQQPAPPALPLPRQHLRARTCSSPGHERETTASIDEVCRSQVC